MKKSKKEVYAYCDATGIIVFGTKVPNGSLPIIKGEDSVVREIMGVMARHGYKNPDKPGEDVLLVPGIPEAESQDEGMTALLAFKKWIGKKSNKDFKIVYK